MLTLNLSVEWFPDSAVTMSCQPQSTLPYIQTLVEHPVRTFCWPLLGPFLWLPDVLESVRVATISLIPQLGIAVLFTWHSSENTGSSTFSYSLSAITTVLWMLLHFFSWFVKVAHDKILCVRTWMRNGMMKCHYFFQFFFNVFVKDQKWKEDIDSWS